MIPQKLSVYNFISYRENVPPLLFDGIHIACLSGENGAGKSAVLDAITWALWGEARGKSDDDVIALGAEETRVTFDFTLNNTLHRVMRGRTKGKRGMTTVEFMVQDGDKWRKIGGDGVRDTNEAIVTALRMRYDTFINSAFLLQGRADEFTNSKPQERKAVLVDILGLAVYEDYEAQAKERHNVLKSEVNNLQGQISDYERTEAQRPFLESELAVARNKVAEAQATLQTAAAQLQALRDQAQRLHLLAEQRTSLAADIVERTAAQRQLQDDIAALRAAVAAAHAMLGERDAINAEYEALQRAERDLAAMAKLLPRAMEIGGRWKDLEHAIKFAAMQIEEEHKRVKNDLAKAEQTAAQHAAQRQAIAALDDEMAEYEATEQQIEDYRAQETALLEQQTQRHALALQHSEHEREIEEARQGLLAFVQMAQQTIDRVTPLVNRRPQLERDIARLHNEITAWDIEAAAVEALGLIVRDAEQRNQGLESELAVITKAGKELTEKIKVVEQGDGACPICQHPLDEAHQHVLLTQYKDDQTSLRTEHRRVKAEVERVTTEVARQRDESERRAKGLAKRMETERNLARLQSEWSQADIAAADLLTAQNEKLDREATLDTQDYVPGAHQARAVIVQQLQALPDAPTLTQRLKDVRAAISQGQKQLQASRDLSRRRAIVEAALQISAEAMAAVPALQTALAAMQAQLESEAYALTERAALAAVRREADALGYSTPAHQALQTERDALLPAAERWNALQHAERSASQEQQRLARDEELFGHRAALLAADQGRLDGFDATLRERPGVEAALGQANQAHQQAQGIVERTHKDEGAADVQLQNCDQVIEQLQGYRAQALALEEQRTIFDELTQAFGKKGIQAMLIDNALPEIEREANALLGRMTDQQMHVRLETQRDTKKGDPLETLDILIADGLGTRDYAMYSGGEAFRVNFALRIALSRLLAHRAGASLKTLIIDEGFGTQDGKGRERIVDAITSVADDFARVLVITHLQELKDMFQTHIEITKNAAGSTWRVVNG